jgi:hypothetical protein
MKTINFLLLIFIASNTYCQSASFTYEYKEDVGKAGRFTLKDSNGKEIFSAPASAGYLGAANNPYFQLTKNAGPIPNGVWEIYTMKNIAQFVFRLRPIDVMALDGPDGKPYRDGFLIHGIGKDSSPDQSSHGCIILAPEYRKILYEYFKASGSIKVTVTNIVH